MPPDGQVYSMFVAEEWPAGNLVTDLELVGRDCIIAADFGVNNPGESISVVAAGAETTTVNLLSGFVFETDDVLQVGAH